MSRRIIDEVSIKAINDTGDMELKSAIIDRFGGREVKDAKTPVIRFNKSLFGLKTTSLGSYIKRVSKDLVPTVSRCEFIDSNGVSHQMTKEAVSILKAVSVYSCTCTVVIAECLDKVLYEIDKYFSSLSSDVVIIDVEDKDTYEDEYKKSKLFKYCQEEVYNLLREAGVNIG